MGKDPLDMNQYRKIFGTCRIPGFETDGLQYNSDSKHIVIVRNNNVSQSVIAFQTIQYVFYDYSSFDCKFLTVTTNYLA